MTEKLSRRGLRVHSSYETDPMQAHHVGEIMSTAVVTLPSDATVGAARQLFATGRHSAYPIVDGDGVMVGIVTRSDLMRDDITDDDPLADHASRDVVTVHPADPALSALQVMLEEDVEHVPVLDGAALVGICTRTDLMRLRARRLDLERHQAGWRPTSPAAAE